MRKPLLLLAVLGAGCFTMVNQHSAQVLRPGSVEFHLGAMMSPEGGGLPAFDAHLGVMPRIQVGARYDILSTSIEARLQLLEAEFHEVDLSLEAGVGTGFMPSPFYYGGVCVSRTFGHVTPYAHIRYMEPKIDYGESEEGEASFAEALYTYLQGEFNRALQVFVGAELELSGNVILVGELVWIPTLENADGDPYIGYNLGLRFRFGGVGPAAPSPAPGREVAPVAPSY